MAVQKKDTGYQGNAFLKKVGEVIEFTADQESEYAKCSESVEYFLENYAKIISLDDGIVKFKPFPYQKKILNAIQGNRKVLVKLFRQSGKSTVVAGYVAWYCLFASQPVRACILANKMSIAREIFSRVQMIIELCPKWMQQGIKEWNKTSFELENDAVCFCAPTSPSAVRGKSISLLVLDEFAFLGGNVAEEFIASVFPTISSSQTSKLVIVSTPKGLNHYYKMWVEAEAGLNGFVAVQGHWYEHPKRDEKWLEEQRLILGDVKFNQEILCEFLGSSNTLIKGEKIAKLPLAQAIAESIDGFKCYERPSKSKSYVMTVDVAEGGGGDFSAFVIFDITKNPFKIVARFKNNSIYTLAYPEVIVHYAKMYNDAFVLVETNSLGQQVADALFYDLEYENMYMSIKDDITDGFGSRAVPGAKTTKKTKQIGCNTIKTIIENDQLDVRDAEIISEMSTFTRRGNTFKAEDGKHDDLMMCLVNFGYLTTTTAFKNLFDVSLRLEFVKNQAQSIQENELPIGFFTNGTEIDETPFNF